MGDKVEIRICCNQMTKPLEKLIEQIRLFGFSITGQKEGKNYQISLEQILYFEAVDNRSYAYCADEVYECKQKLYELEERLSYMNFQRISRTCIVNIYKLISNVNSTVSAEGKFPLVVFSHGANGVRRSNLSTYHKLASHGYVVCSIDHTYHSFFTEQEEGKKILIDPEYLNETLTVSQK